MNRLKDFKVGTRVVIVAEPFALRGKTGTVVGVDARRPFPIRVQVLGVKDHQWFTPDELSRRPLFLHTAPEPKSPRADALDEAKELITGDRNASYGPPTQDFKRSSDALSGLGYRKLDQEGNPVPLESHDTALIVAVVKMSRLMWTPGKRDSWVDGAGYFACGYECAVEEGHAEKAS